MTTAPPPREAILSTNNSQKLSILCIQLIDCLHKQTGLLINSVFWSFRYFWCARSAILEIEVAVNQHFEADSRPSFGLFWLGNLSFLSDSSVWMNQEKDKEVCVLHSWTLFPHVGEPDYIACSGVISRCRHTPARLFSLEQFWDGGELNPLY